MIHRILSRGTARRTPTTITMWARCPRFWERQWPWPPLSKAPFVLCPSALF